MYSRNFDKNSPSNLNSHYFARFQLSGHFLHYLVCIRRIYIDNGPQFKSNYWKEYSRKQQIEVRFTSTYTPSSNPVERRMSVIQALIRLHCSDKHSRWPLVLQDIENRINFVENGSTRASVRSNDEETGRRSIVTALFS